MPHEEKRRIVELFAIRTALKNAVGENASWKQWQYRMGNIPHIALDIEGMSGLVNWTIIVNGNLKISTEEQICRGREPVTEVFDCVDAFYFVEALLEAFRS